MSLHADRLQSSRLLRSLLVLASMTIAACGVSADEEDAASDDQPILGGEPDYGTSAVGMLHFASGNFGTGTLISPTVVLTAAHVARGRPTHFYFGTPAIGKSPLFGNLEKVEVAESVVHPDYNDGRGPRSVDLALVRLKAPITHVKPMPLTSPFGSFLFYPIATRCTAVGFGAHLGEDKKASFASRRRATSDVRRIGAVEMVVGRQSGIATSGDSGGPLLCKGALVGTVRGAAIASEGKAGYERTEEAYVIVDRQRGWIDMTMLGWHSEPAPQLFLPVK